MKLYLIRHGQTEWNIAGKIQGKTDIPLNETGLSQASLLAAAMETHEITAVYTSPLKRAYETACFVAGPHKLSVCPVEELREVDFGLWEGLTWEEIEKRYEKDFRLWDLNPVDHTPTGGEKKESSRARSRRAMERILSDADGDIVIVAHGGILVFVVSFLLAAQQDKNEVIVKNASITTVEYDKITGKGELLSLNDISHLKEIQQKRINKFC